VENRVSLIGEIARSAQDYLEMARRGNLAPEKQNEYLQKANSEIQRLIAVADNS
jgi:hypothetical protein